MPPFWSRERLAAALDTLEGQLQAASAAAGALDAVAWPQDDDPNTPESDWAGYAKRLYNPGAGTTDTVSQVKAMKARLELADDGVLRGDYLAVIELADMLHQLGTRAAYGATDSSDIGKLWAGVRNSLRLAESDAHMVLLGYGDVRRNERRAKAQAASER